MVLTEQFNVKFQDGVGSEQVVGCRFAGAERGVEHNAYSTRVGICILHNEQEPYNISPYTIQQQ